jgi:hypothetical protein
MWKIERCNIYNFMISKENIKEGLKLVEIGVVGQGQGGKVSNCFFELIGMYRGKCIVGVIDVDGKCLDVVFQYNGKTSQEYYKDNMLNLNKNYFGVLEKCYEDYY